jgi:hypothetical protein
MSRLTRCLLPHETVQIQLIVLHYVYPFVSTVFQQLIIIVHVVNGVLHSLDAIQGASISIVSLNSIEVF